jgi:hypothetical protein
MYIVPILSKDRPNTELKQIWLFLERNGNHLIELACTPQTAVQAAKEFLATNEMQAMGEPAVSGELIFVQIDPSSKDLASFYTWREVPVGTIPSKEVWRSFLWLSAKDNADPFGVNRLLDTIPLSDSNHSAFSVVSSYLKTCY